MTTPADILSYSPPQTPRHVHRAVFLLRAAAVLLFVYMLCFVTAHTYAHWAFSMFALGPRAPITISGITFDLRSFQLYFVISAGLALLYVLGGAAYLRAGRAARRSERFWPLVALTIAIVQIPCILGDLYPTLRDLPYSLPEWSFRHAQYVFFVAVVGTTVCECLSLITAVALVFVLPRCLRRTI